MSTWLLREALGNRKPEGEVVLNHPDGKRTYRIKFDASKGNMASQCQYTCKTDEKTEFKFDIRVSNWQRVGTKWFPRKVERTSFFNGQRSQEETFVIKNVKVGKEVPPLPAMPRPQRNAIVLDEERRVWYRVDENWKRITTEMPTSAASVGGG